MLEALLAAAFFLFPAVVTWFLHAADFKPLSFSIPTFVIISLFVFSYAGVLPLYLGWDDYYFNPRTQDTSLVLNMFFFSSWTIVAMIFGFLVSKKVLGFGAESPFSGAFRPLNGGEVFLFAGVLLLCQAVLALYLKNLPSVALFVALGDTGGIRDASMARSLMGNDFEGKYHWYSLFMHDVMNFTTFSLFAHWLIRKTKTSFLLFMVAVLSAGFSSIVSIEKGPIAWLLIGLFLVYVITVRGGKYPMKGVFKLALFLVGFLVVFRIYVLGTSEVGNALKAIFSRTFMGGIAPAYYYLEYFPRHVDFLMGRSFPNPGGLLPFTNFPLTVEVSTWMTSSQFMDPNIVGSAPTVFWAEMWANFGLTGVLLAPLAVGSFLQALSHYIDKIENTPLKIGVVVWLALHYKNLSETGLAGFIFDGYLMIIMGLSLFIIALSNHGKVKLMRMTGKASAH